MIAFEFAELASDRADWDEAVRRWVRATALSPDNYVARHHLAQARWNIGMSSAAESLHADAPTEPSAQPASEPDSTGTGIFEKFESLGENCEFGLVQRYFGFEPLGLLRFTAISPAAIVELLKARLEGIGDPALTTLTDSGSEYTTSNTRFGLFSHTFVAPHSVDRDRFYKEQCKRLIFLRRKLLEDLQDASKIFVFTAGQDSDENGFAVHDALREYGNNRLLYVRLAGPGAEPGSFRLVRSGLVFGYLPELFTGMQEVAQASCARWLPLCRGAYGLLNN